MIRKFLTHCNCLISSEAEDFYEVKAKIGEANPFLVLQPMITYDFAPMYMLENTDAWALIQSDRGEHIYICPIGAHDFCMKQELESLIHDFYLYDELPDEIGYDSYKLCIDEVLLLNYSDFISGFEVKGFGTSNVVYVSGNISNHKKVHILFICDKADVVWNILKEKYAVNIDVLVESKKGMGDCFVNTSLFAAMNGTKTVNGLPGFILQGIYTGGLPQEYSYLCGEKHGGKQFDFYITPWGKQNPTYASMAKCIKELYENERKKYDEKRREFHAFLRNQEGHFQIQIIRDLAEHIGKVIKTDGGVACFSNVKEIPFYFTYDQKPTEQLIHRAELFLYLSALFVFEENANERKKALNKLNELIYYHIKRVQMHEIYKNAYDFYGAYNEIRYFVDEIYEYVKCLSCHNVFASVIAGEDYNYLEEELLKCAYRKRDNNFAHWIIENNFHGRIQSELYRIIFKNDIEKAKEIASRLAPICIAWILKDTCKYEKNSDFPYISEEIRLIFKQTTKEKVMKVEQYIKKYQKKGYSYCIPVFQELCKKDFL